MAVIAILISILSPALSSIRESARQVVCRSDQRQVGIGIAMYADASRDRIPISVNAAASAANGDPWDSVDLRLAPVGTGPGPWDGLGLLYRDGIMPAAKIFYCPSHHGSAPYADYASIWAGGTDRIVGNFQYRALGPTDLKTPANPHPRQIGRLSLIQPQSAIVTDAMRSQEDFNHRIGANVLRAGLEVDWWCDSGRFASQLPKEGQIPNQPNLIIQNWETLDTPSH
jgi:hypothetical protein